jgi:HK97 family phage portal protein
MPLEPVQGAGVLRDGPVQPLERLIGLPTERVDGGDAEDPIDPRFLREHCIERSLGFPGVAEGVGPLQAARHALSGYLDVDAYASDFYGQAVPQGTLATEQDIPPETAERYKAKWLESRDPVRVLGSGLTFDALRLSPRDAAWIEARQWNAAEVARVYGVPAYKLNLASESGMTYTNAQDLDRAYLRDCVSSYTGPIEDALDDLTPPGRGASDETVVRFDFDALLRPNVTERFAAYAAALTGGWLTPAEVRKLEGLAPTPEVPA